MNNSKIYSYKFSDIYPLYVSKIERKGRNIDELDTVICWLTGYNKNNLKDIIRKEISLKTFFDEAPLLNPNRTLITGSICGIKIENIVDPFIKNIRYMDKLVDELAKGKSLEKILR